MSGRNNGELIAGSSTAKIGPGIHGLQTIEASVEDARDPEERRKLSPPVERFCGCLYRGNIVAARATTVLPDVGRVKDLPLLVRDILPVSESY